MINRRRPAGPLDVLNVGCAVTGPEVLLKAVSMAANVGRPPRGIVTADFDLRSYDPSLLSDEDSAAYYYRDQKSVVARIPGASGGEGTYIQADEREALPYLYYVMRERNGT